MEKTGLLKSLKMRVGQAEIPDWQFRRYLLVFFFLASGVFMWTPTQWLVKAFRDFSVFRGINVEAVAPASRAADVPLGRGLLARPGDESADAVAKKPRAVVFRLLAPAAQAVYVGGSFNNFDARQQPMTRRPDGTWETSVDLAPGRYLYKFKVDGQWELDPTNPEKTPAPRTSSVLTIQ